MGEDELAAIMVLTEYIQGRYLGLAICYVSLGRNVDAMAEAAEVLRIYPGFSLSYYAETLPFKEQSEIAEAVESLRRTG